MFSHPLTDGTTDAALDEQFADLICSDADLLADEFDAIIAAEWPDPPSGRRGCSGDDCWRTDRASARWILVPRRGPVARPRGPGVGEWARQRSPPPAAIQPKMTKEGR